jgi:hypothetical protein
LCLLYQIGNVSLGLLKSLDITFFYTTAGSVSLIAYPLEITVQRRYADGDDWIRLLKPNRRFDTTRLIG